MQRKLHGGKSQGPRLGWGGAGPGGEIDVGEELWECVEHVKRMKFTWRVAFGRFGKPTQRSIVLLSNHTHPSASLLALDSEIFLPVRACALRACCPPAGFLTKLFDLTMRSIFQFRGQRAAVAATRRCTKTRPPVPSRDINNGMT